MGFRSSSASLAAACALVLLHAAPALAGATDPPSGVVDQAKDAAHSTVDQVGDSVAGVAGDVADTASNATGGATDPVTDPVQDVVDQVNETAGDTTGQVEDTVDNAARPVDHVVDEVDHATGGVIGDVTGSGGRGDKTPGETGDGTKRHPGATAFESHGHVRARRPSVRARRVEGLTRRDATRAAPVARPAQSSTVPSTTAPAPSLGERVGRAAVDAAKQLALPLGLTLVVLGFVVAQHWMDRKDPKLALAPTESDFDLLTFR